MCASVHGCVPRVCVWAIVRAARVYGKRRARARVPRCGVYMCARMLAVAVAVAVAVAACPHLCMNVAVPTAKWSVVCWNQWGTSAACPPRAHISMPHTAASTTAAGVAAIMQTKRHFESLNVLQWCDDVLLTELLSLLRLQPSEAEFCEGIKCLSKVIERSKTYIVQIPIIPLHSTATPWRFDTFCPSQTSQPQSCGLLSTLPSNLSRSATFVFAFFGAKTKKKNCPLFQASCSRMTPGYLARAGTRARVLPARDMPSFAVLSARLSAVGRG